ncbi:STAS domain-containing protein [Microbispora sp. RL4-1S]|uniref:Anti-sigma factor antagonist n=1 Tax=Microbispora oryzae TaxID=2806554 RepID=A0A940WK24_9ACTN|nr:STAS domain-containing protein [Microbispora oryzae]MBP2707090.1 STAS domain-containing protein [Microbispora oryzae]
MTTRLAVRVGREATHTVVVLTGELDVISADDLRASLAKVLQDGHTDVIVDAGGLTFCDSMGLRLLLEYLDLFTEAGGFLRLAGVHGAVLRILTVTGLRSAFPIYDTVADAARG